LVIAGKRGLCHDGSVRAGRQTSHTTVAEITINERWLSWVYGDDGFCPAHFPGHALATNLTQAVVYVRNFGGEWVIWHNSILVVPFTLRTFYFVAAQVPGIE